MTDKLQPTQKDVLFARKVIQKSGGLTSATERRIKERTGHTAAAIAEASERLFALSGNWSPGNQNEAGGKKR